MLILLPPSETKRDGGEGGPIDYSTLRHPRLNTRRRAVARRVVALARTPDEAMRRLKLGPKLVAEVERNRRIAAGATMPAMDRYTGVLYEAFDAPSLSGDARAFAGEHVRIHSALYGLLGAGDPIPAYRLSHDSRLEGDSLKAVWAAAISRELVAHRDELVLDLRSEGYTALGPVPPQVTQAHYLRVVTRGDDGVQRALNHFNKRGKGLFTRALVEEGRDFGSVTELIDWGSRHGHRLALSGGGELLLEV